MRNFIKKYIRSFKEAKSQQKPKILKPSKKVVNVFCEGKELVSNQDLHENTLKILYNILNPASAWWNRFTNGTLELNGNDIDYYHNMAENYTYLCAMYFSLEKPDENTTNFYFKRLDDLSNTNSYPSLPPPPQSAYPGWVKGNNKVHINSNPNNPFCVEVPADPFNVLANNFTAADINTARPDFYALGPSPGSGDVISNYSRPGFTNIFFKKGFSIASDLTKDLNQHPDLSIFDGNTPDPNNPQQNLPKIGFRKWTTSDSDFPNENGVMQSTTPYSQYSYKDFIFRVKNLATNPKTQGGSQILKFDYRLKYYFNHPVTGGPAYELQLNEYSSCFIGVHEDMNAHEVYNHCQNILFTPYWEIPNTPQSYGTNPNSSAALQPLIVTAQSPPPGWNNTYDPNIPWFTPSTPEGLSNAYLDQSYAYAQSSFSGLPSGSSFNKQEKLQSLGRVGMHNHGVENCLGCDAGCFYNWKIDEVHCTDNNNKAWPFKSVDDCENYLSLYDSPCPKNPPIFDDGEIPVDDNGSVITVGVKQVWKCNHATGNCSYQGTIPVSQSMPANTYTSLALCQNACKCLSDCCKKPFATPGLLQSTNFCISQFRLYHMPSVWIQFYPGNPIPSNFQPYPNDTLSVGTSLRMKYCVGQNVMVNGALLERWDSSSSTWLMMYASSSATSSAVLGNPLPGRYRLSIFASNVLPKPGVVLQPTGYNGVYNNSSINLPVSNLVDQAYIKFKLVQNISPIYSILEEQPLTYMDESSVKFPSCSPQLTKIDDVEVPG